AKEKVVPIVPDPEVPDLMSQKELAVAQRADSTLLHCFILIDKNKEKKLQDVRVLPLPLWCPHPYPHQVFQ
ncbi:hypothetical protein P4O66_018009, partial [Electrophorus voltai]